MHIAVVGAGAIGCLLGARLGARGHRITLVGRSEQVEAIARQGLLVRDPRTGDRRYRLHATTRLAEAPDLVLLTVKTQDLAQACRDVLPVARNAPVVTMQNGLRADRIAAAVLGPEAVVGAVVLGAASYLRPGEVSVEFPGWLLVGEPYGPVASRAHAIAEVLAGAVPTFVTSNLAGARWSKLLANLNNALCAATGRPLAELVRAPTGRRVAVRALREGSRVARAGGVRLERGLHRGLLARDRLAASVALLQSSLTMLPALPEPVAGGLLALAARGSLKRLPIRGSTWQSLARGRPTEIDYLNGEVVGLGRRLGVPTPYNARLVDLVHQVERTGRFRRVDELAPPGAQAVARPPTSRTLAP